MAIKTYKLNDSGKGRGMAKATHLHIDNKSTNRDALTLETVSDGAASGPLMSLVRRSSSPAKSDVLGKIQFKGQNSAGTLIRYGSIDCAIRDVNEGTDDSKITFTTRKAGQHKAMLIVQNDGIIAHIDAPIVLQNTGWKKTRITGSATARRDIVMPDQSGTVVVNESGKIMAADLPTSDPNNTGQLWNDSGTVKISAG